MSEDNNHKLGKRKQKPLLSQPNSSAGLAPRFPSDRESNHPSVSAPTRGRSPSRKPSQYRPTKSTRANPKSASRLHQGDYGVSATSRRKIVRFSISSEEPTSDKRRNSPPNSSGKKSTSRVHKITTATTKPTNDHKETNDTNQLPPQRRSSNQHREDHTDTTSTSATNQQTIDQDRSIMNPSKGNTREHQQRIQPPSRASSTRRGDKHNARLSSPSNVDSVSPRQLRPRLEPNRSTFRKNASPKQSRSRLQPNRTAHRRSASPPQSRPQIDPNELAFRRSTFPMPQSRPPLQPKREDFRRDASPTRMRQTLEPNKTASQNIPRGPSALKKREERSHSPPTQGRSRTLSGTSPKQSDEDYSVVTELKTAASNRSRARIPNRKTGTKKGSPSYVHDGYRSADLSTEGSIDVDSLYEPSSSKDGVRNSSSVSFDAYGSADLVGRSPAGHASTNTSRLSSSLEQLTISAVPRRGRRPPQEAKRNANTHAARDRHHYTDRTSEGPGVPRLESRNPSISDNFVDGQGKNIDRVRSDVHAPQPSEGRQDALPKDRMKPSTPQNWGRATNQTPYQSTRFGSPPSPKQLNAAHPSNKFKSNRSVDNYSRESAIESHGPGGHMRYNGNSSFESTSIDPIEMNLSDSNDTNEIFQPLSYEAVYDADSNEDKSTSIEYDEYYKHVFAEDKKEEATLNALVEQKFHIPGNSWLEDWLAYFGNNHPVFGICFHHHMHPIGTLNRLWILFGSMAFGLALTNFMYLGFVMYSDDGIDGTIQIAQFNSTGDGTDFVVNSVGNAVNGVSKYELILWLVGSPLHGFFDHLIWYLESASCFRPGGSLERYRWFGSFLAVFCVLSIVVSASLAVILRALKDTDRVALESISDSASIVLDESGRELVVTNLSGSEFDFLIWWYVELSLEYFVFNFVVGTIFFSGILSCGGRLKMFAGRPGEIEELEKDMEKAREGLNEELKLRKLERIQSHYNGMSHSTLGLPSS